LTEERVLLCYPSSCLYTSPPFGAGGVLHQMEDKSVKTLLKAGAYHQFIFRLINESGNLSIINKASNGTLILRAVCDKRLKKAYSNAGLRPPTSTPKPRAEGSSPSAPATRKTA